MTVEGKNGSTEEVAIFQKTRVELRSRRRDDGRRRRRRRRYWPPPPVPIQYPATETLMRGAATATSIDDVDGVGDAVSQRRPSRSPAASRSMTAAGHPSRVAFRSTGRRLGRRIGGSADWISLSFHRIFIAGSRRPIAPRRFRRFRPPSVHSVERLLRPSPPSAPASFIYRPGPDSSALFLWPS